MTETKENEGTQVLRKLLERHRLKISKYSDIQQNNSDDLMKVRLSGRDGNWIIYISDEQEEFHEKRQLLGLYMILDALRNYTTSKDYLEWCRDEEVDPGNSILRQYYMDLSIIEKQVRNVIGDYKPIVESIHFDIPFRDEIDSKILLGNLDTDD